MALLRRTDNIPAGLTKVLLPGENLVAAVHSHWARVAEPVISTVAGLVVTVFVDANLTKDTEAIGTLLWWGWFFLFVRMAYHLASWRHDWFVATDKRLLLRYGLITHKVAMMPLIKVTDMSYVRSIPGQFLGYGRFVMESAGQDQALRLVDWVPNPDETYRAICAEMFHIVAPTQSGPAVAERDEFEDGGDGSDGAAGHSSDPYPDVPSIHNPVQDRLEKYSRAMPIQPSRRSESLYESEDLRRRRRGADTGPLPLRPRHEPRTD